MESLEKICVRCQRPVIRHRDEYEIFEHMHWLCFHLEFEHDGDPDEPCADPGCPWWQIQVYQDKLNSLGENPQSVLDNAIKRRGCIR